MKLKCISPRLNYVAFDQNGNPRRVRVGETFTIKGKEIPKKWAGLVIEVGGRGGRQAVTNPADSQTADAAKASEKA